MGHHISNFQNWSVELSGSYQRKAEVVIQVFWNLLADCVVVRIKSERVILKHLTSLGVDSKGIYDLLHNNAQTPVTRITTVQLLCKNNQKTLKMSCFMGRKSTKVQFKNKKKMVKQLKKFPGSLVCLMHTQSIYMLHFRMVQKLVQYV